MISISRSADPICLIFKRTPIFNGIQLNFTIMQNGKLFLSYKNEKNLFGGFKFHAGLSKCEVVPQK